MQLPVFDIITEACRDTWENRRDFAAFAFLPVLVVSLIGTLTVALIGELPANVEGPTQVSPQIATRLFIGISIYGLASFVFYTLFAVPWHRRTLIGPEAVTVGMALRWGRRQWHFFRRLVLIFINLTALSLFLLVILGNALPIGPATIAPIFSALLIVVSLVYGRLAMVLPAAATDTKMKFAESAKLTSGNSWRIMFGVVLVPLIVWFVGGMTVILAVSPLAELIGSSITAQFIVSLIRHTVNYIGFAVGITALSIAYRQLTA